MTDAKPKRHWLRFSIRDLLLLTAIVALSVGWWLDHRKLTKENLAKIKIFKIAEADPKALFDNIEQLYAEDRDVTLSLDSDQKLIMARGPIHQVEEIEAILLKLDASPTSSGGQTQGH
jgi:hypothetical protein